MEIFRKCVDERVVAAIEKPWRTFFPDNPFMALQRTREIGIRKTLGSTVPGIIMLLSRDFILPVLVAIAPCLMETKSHNIKLAVPFFMGTDMEASLRFYREGLGFKLTNQRTTMGKIEWCWLQRDVVAIMLQEAQNNH